MSDLVPPHVHKALGFVALVNVSDVFPPKSTVNAFVHAETPRKWGNASGVAAGMVPVSLPPGSVAEYLVETGLAIEHGGGLKLTKVGLALNSGLQTPEKRLALDQPLLEVVGRLEDPVVYARLLTEIDKLDGALVVDPYLPAADLLALLELPSVERVLSKDTWTKGVKRDARRRHLQLALGAKPEVELRFLDSEIQELHDRLVLPRRGLGLMIGTSLGGTQVTVITHLSDDTTSLLRRHYEDLWQQAVPVAPIARGAVEE
ncbi:hypothetical protein [Salinibacterium sp. ZJ77]|uniref:hypothetical protein n=1 Tax=Salinibacterium sp. ZJ77 TaxID=2708337 RepID=UPI001422B00A|nr:hypothetical protein [Salinibacterium sp. ZJ77]